jgi:hypothetical protein
MTPEQRRIEQLEDILESLIITHGRSMAQTSYAELWDEARQVLHNTLMVDLATKEHG